MTYACLSCITDVHLRQSLPVDDVPCAYCESAGPSVHLHDLVRACDLVLDSFFETTHRHPAVTLYDRAPSGMDLHETLSYLKFAEQAGRGDALLEDVAEHLNALWWDDDSGVHKHSGEDQFDEPYFRLRSDLGEAWSHVWDLMQTGLQNEARYINPNATRVLKQLFGTIHSEVTDEAQPVVVTAGPGTFLTKLFRARTFQEEAPLEEALGHPARHLGTPPPRASVSGRMNARGQAAFYGASTAEVAVYEVRPFVGAWVASAAFELVKPVKLLDLRRLARIHPHPGQSLFNPESLELSRRRGFLSVLVERLLQPVMPDLAERDYLPTQVVADFLATHEVEPLDGIIYPTVQKPDADADTDFNVALFHRASRVGGADGQQIGSARLWDWEDREDKPRLSPELWLSTGCVDADVPSRLTAPSLHSARPITLAVQVPSLKVDRVRAVEICRSTSSVHLRR